MRFPTRLGLAAAVLLAGCTAAPDGTAAPGGAEEARVVATTSLSPRMLDLTVESPALGRTATVRLLLPARFAAEPARRWPTLWLLHGCCDSYGSWTAKTDVAELTAAAGVLVVIPEGGRAGFYSDWLRGPRWESFHLDEVRRLLEAGYRASDVRAVAGVSMGGLGALAYAARHPGMFRAAASFSGVVHTGIDAAAPARYQGLLRGEAEDDEALWGDPVANADVWRAHNPYDLADRLRGTALYVSCGTGAAGPLDGPAVGPDATEAVLNRENTALAARLRSLGVPARIELYGPGTHSWPYWERELHRAWPLLERALT